VAKISQNYTPFEDDVKTKKQSKQTTPSNSQKGAVMKLARKEDLLSRSGEIKFSELNLSKQDSKAHTRLSLEDTLNSQTGGSKQVESKKSLINA